MIPGSTGEAPDVGAGLSAIASSWLRKPWDCIFAVSTVYTANTEKCQMTALTSPVIEWIPAERTFYEWKKGKAIRVPEDTLRRIGYVAGIWKALQIVYSDAELADGWIKRPNAFFGGQTPLERMAAGDVTDLAAVRAYIDAARAPWS